jgi:hypothetical protein
LTKIISSTSNGRRSSLEENEIQKKRAWFVNFIFITLVSLFVCFHFLIESEKHVIIYSELKIKKEVGSGAFGRVFKAVWREMDCAVKELSSLTVKQRKKFFLCKIFSMHLILS